MWSHGSVGRAPCSHRGGHRFEPCCDHHKPFKTICFWGLFYFKFSLMLSIFLCSDSWIWRSFYTLWYILISSWLLPPRICSAKQSYRVCSPWATPFLFSTVALDFSIQGEYNPISYCITLFLGIYCLIIAFPLYNYTNEITVAYGWLPQTGDKIK